MPNECMKRFPPLKKRYYQADKEFSKFIPCWNYLGIFFFFFLLVGKELLFSSLVRV